MRSYIHRLAFALSFSLAFFTHIHTHSRARILHCHARMPHGRERELVGAPAISPWHGVSCPSNSCRATLVTPSSTGGDDDDDGDRCTTTRHAQSSRVGLPRLFKFALTVSFGEHPRRHRRLPIIVRVYAFNDARRRKLVDPLLRALACLFETRRDVTDPLLLPPSTKLPRWRTPRSRDPRRILMTYRRALKGRLERPVTACRTLVTWPGARACPMRVILP